MPYCPKCGAEINEEMTFCSKCGAPLKAGAQASVSQRVERRSEKGEKNEKEERERQEKREKGEKHEKRGYGLLGPIIGGVILICLGLASFLEWSGVVSREVVWAFFLVAIGVIVIFGALIGMRYAYRRNPQT